MSNLEILLTAAALSMDAFAVSIGVGACLSAPSVAPAFRMGAACGGFQFAMPLIGWCLGVQLLGFIEAYDHWVAFVILFFLGVNMIRESQEEKSCNGQDHTHGAMLLSLALATSIDALAAGIGVAALKGSVLLLAVPAGIITGGLSAFGVFLGFQAGRILGKYVEIAGGLVLCGIGLRILLVSIL
ncbi:manganese efflux pump MntP family protein [Aminobacterium mobile]|jgi:putative Mn2+ efflux pump MntP|uniref:manganese efflux pump MntP n=1 Tax=Aminobacterium mobile TaxID=81467 RepID=UPI0004656E44|nr:manganese efflux pump MntP family protein [Aminobacterium mobile]